MKVMIRKTASSALSAYAEEGPEEPTSRRARRLWGARSAVQRLTLALPEMAPDTKLPITVEARRLSGD
jgi:nitrogen fixation protein NifT